MAASLSTSLLVAPIVAGLNHVLKAEPALLERAKVHAGKRIDFRAAPFPRQSVAIEQSGFIGASDADGAADLVIDASLSQLIVDRWSRDALLKHLQFTGDDALAELVRDAVRRASFDIEDELAKVIGDIPARRLGATATALRDGIGESIERMGQNIAEYLAHERNVLVSSTHLDSFAADLSSIEARLDALAARIEHIERGAPPMQ